MVTLSTDVLVIGGGATGAGVAWDAALRGFDVVLVDRRDLAEGTSGRFHGLLHSGRALRGQGSARRRGVHRREPDPAPGRRRLRRGHGRPVRHHPVGRPRLRRRVRPGLPGDRRRLRGDQRRRRRCATSRGSTRRSRAPSGSRTRNIDVWKTVWAMGARRAAARRAGAALPRGRSRSTATATR